MSRKIQLALAAALALAIAPAIALSQTAPKAPAKTSSAKAPYKAPRLFDGHPDISGFWQNGTMTKLERDTKMGDRKVYTPEEAAQIEGTNAARTARLNAPTDPKLQQDWLNIAKGPDTLDECQSGSRGPGCGYNAGWTDPGSTLMRVNGEARTSLITYPANGRVPAPKSGARVARGPVNDDGEGEGAPAARGGAAGAGRGAAAAAGGRGGVAGGGRGGGAPRGGQYANPEDVGGAMRCITSFGRGSGPIMLSQLYNNNYQFVQGKDTLAIWVEMVHDVRIVRMGPNAKHRTDGIRPYAGDSIGHWEGDTLVVETTNFPPSMNLSGSSANLTMIEKFTRVSPSRMLYQFEARDPTLWDQPWGGEYEFVRSDGIYEYACHEGNYALEGVLAGSRQADQEAGIGPRAAATPAAQAR